MLAAAVFDADQVDHSHLPALKARDDVDSAALVLVSPPAAS